MLFFKFEKKGGSFWIQIEEKGKKRVLYLDTFQKAALPKEKALVDFLIKLHLRHSRNLETLVFDRIEIPPSLVSDALRLLECAGFKKEETKEELPLSVTPLLILSDRSGSFANLWMDYGSMRLLFSDFCPRVEGKERLRKEEKEAEKDLLEAGYVAKRVGESEYFCPKEKVKEALSLLLSVGWRILQPSGETVHSKIEVKEERGKIFISASIPALLDVRLQMAGVWEKEKLVLKKGQAKTLGALLGEPNVHWEGALERLALFARENSSLPRAQIGDRFQGKLLPYQQKGVDWLSFLYEWGFGAFLADEMGLGKTVQVLAFLSRLDERAKVLIVAPLSLLFNWQREIDRFLPGKKEYKLLSYAALRLQQERLSQEGFDVVILDESQAIKNCSTQTAKAACRLQAQFKICLSGTPMENRPEELVSQFQFLMPDFLDPTQPLQKEEIRPFLLRRKKEEVQPELPEKIEQIVWLEMEEEQKEVYRTYQQGFRLDGASRMEILEAILRLRQICCDPRLVGSPILGVKLAQVQEDLKEAKAACRKVLIYSQFTSLLQILYEEFPDALYLDGTMSPQKRKEVVESFQENPAASLFFLSLKAGGVGLNLTAADAVFILDPWWNDALERQAIDRAHRIGRKKTVLAKRYLTVGTVEEKMLQLKEKKLQAADLLLEEKGGAWTEEELLQLLS